MYQDMGVYNMGEIPASPLKTDILNIEHFIDIRRILVSGSVPACAFKSHKFLTVEMLRIQWLFLNSQRGGTTKQFLYSPGLVN